MATDIKPRWESGVPWCSVSCCHYDKEAGWCKIEPPNGFIGHVLEVCPHAVQRMAAENRALRAALEAIMDMTPEYPDIQLSDHSECEECKRIKSIKCHVSTCCDDLYREIRARDKRNEYARRAQDPRMRAIARDTLCGYPAAESEEE